MAQNSVGKPYDCSSRYYHSVEKNKHRFDLQMSLTLSKPKRPFQEALTSFPTPSDEQH